MVAFNKQRVQHDDETKRMIYEEYTTTRKSMAQVAEKYNINVNTVNNIVKKFKAQKKKEAQFFKDNNIIPSKPKPKPLSVAQEVQRFEQYRKPNNDKHNDKHNDKPNDKPNDKLINKPRQETRPPPQQKPKDELRKSGRRETITINTSQGAPAEPFRPRPPKSKDEMILFNKAEKKLDRRNSLANIVKDMEDRLYNK